MPNALAGRLLEAMDPVAFAKRAGLALHPYQIALVRSHARQVLLNWSRQSGKSTAVSLLTLHEAYFTPKSLTLLLSPSERQSKLLLDKVKAAAFALNEPGIIDVDNALYLRLGNGSEVYALPGKEETLRGFSGVDLLIVDEASRVLDSLYHSVRPMLAASAGRVALLSTPFGKRGFFFNEWTKGAGTWLRSEVTVDQVPHISREFLEEERASLPPELFAQEYYCQFTDTVDQLFTHELVASLLSDDIEPLFGGSTTSPWTALLTETGASPFDTQRMPTF